MTASTYVNTPDDLVDVTDVDHAAEMLPEAGNLSQRSLDAIWSAVEDLYRSGAYPAISFCLRRGDQILLNRSIGHIRGNGPIDPETAEKVPIRTTDPVCIYSASKAVTAMLVHSVAETGAINLDAPVAEYIPEFSRHGKDKTTVSAVLAHKGGFPMFDLPIDEITPDLLTRWDDIIEMLCDMPAPRRRTPRLAYHAVTGGYILAEVLQRATGKTVRELLRERFGEPMGMTYFDYGLDPKYRDRVAKNYVAGAPVRFPLTLSMRKMLGMPFDDAVEYSNTEGFMNAVIPAGNIYATAEELSRFYQMMLNDGEWNGRDILQPDTIRRAIRPATKLQFDHTLKIPMRYSEGLMLGANPFGVYGPMSGNSYGHIGLMNIYGWADPDRDLSVGMLVTGKAVLGTHLIALGKLLTTLTWHCG